MPRLRLLDHPFLLLVAAIAALGAACGGVVQTPTAPSAVLSLGSAPQTGAPAPAADALPPTTALGATSFLAFGDSITEGVVRLSPLIMLGPPDTYPFKLEQMLRSLYPAQAVIVVNEGKSGDDSRELAGRLPSVLDAHNPEVLLVHGGINNINGLSTATQASAFRTMILDAQGHGAEVVIATLLPMLPASSQYRATTPGKIDALNAEIFRLAGQYNLAVVDLFAIFSANQQFMGSDGLHPSAEGQTRIAEAFRDEIVRRYENPSTSSLRFSTMRLSR